MATSEELYPLAVLIDELRHDDVAVRVKAMSNVSTIGLALGESRTRTELVPFLEEVAQEDEDEILVVLADELAKFVPLVGGADNSSSLIPVLATLAACEEPTVRDAAVHTLTVVGDAMTPASAVEHFDPLVKRLSSADWFSSRMSATGLYATALRKGHDLKLLSLYKDLVVDDAPMVRRAAATNLPRVIEALPEDGISGSAASNSMEAITGMLEQLATDDQDSVRLLSVDVVIALARRQDGADEALTKRAFDLLEDKSWRVRYMAADRFEQLATVIIQPDSSTGTKSPDELAVREHFVEFFVRLSKDPEAEVRNAIAKRVVGFANLLDEETILREVVPSLEFLTEDDSEHVREALATQISHVSGLLGREKTIQHLLPLFLHMLKDEHSEVRLQIISNLQVINQVIGIELLSESLIPAISDLAKDKQWRVLLAIIEYLPLLADQLGVEFSNKELVPMAMQWLWDPVWAIRDAAAASLVRLADVFGTAWLEAGVAPEIMVLEEDANYLYRLSALLAVKTLIPALSLPFLTDHVLPFILTLVDDSVPNIRFNCARALQVLATTMLSKSADSLPVVLNTVVPVLEKHVDDKDVDVRYFVSTALSDISALTASA